MNSLKKKASSLINVSRRDSSIFTTSNSFHISIGNLVNKNDLLRFFDSKESSLTINLLSSSKIENIKKELNKAANYKNFLLVINKYGISISTTKLNILSSNFNEINKKEAIESALNFIKSLNEKLISLNRKAKEISKNKGTWNLFLTRYFLKGMTPYKRQVINSPLIFHKVEIIFIDSKIILKKVSDYNELNEKLIMFLQKDIGKQKKPISSFFEFSDIYSIKKQLEDVIEMELKIDSDNLFLFKKENSFEIEKKYPNLIIEDNVCLGIFEPWGGRLKDDLEKLIELNEIDNIFDKPKFISPDDIKMKELYQTPLIQIDKLDIYQKWAIRSSLINNTIIHGPPGTGKSEVITNIIANIVANKNNVLIVSEKAAALEVIKKRLKELSIFSLSIYSIEDKDKFYNSILNLADFLGTEWKHDYFRYSESDKNIKFLSDVFNKKDQLKKLYEKIKSLKDNKWKKYSFLEFTHELNKFGGLSKLNKISSSNLINKYSSIINTLKIGEEDFFNKLNEFIVFCNKNKLDDNENNFIKFYSIAIIVKKYFEQVDKNTNDKEFLEDLKLKASSLNSYLNLKKDYQQILSTNPDKFYEDVKKYILIKNKYSSILNKKFFENFFENLPLLNKFIKTFDYASKNSKKYIFDLFIKKLEIVEKKPWNKIYLKKLSQKNLDLISDLRILASMHLENYRDFNYVIENHEMFNPLVVIYFFDKKLFQTCFEFIKQNLIVFDYEFIKLNREFNMNFSLWKDFHNISNLRLFFEHDYHEIINGLLQTKIDELCSINWNHYTYILKNEIRNLILEKLSNINFSYKEMIQKAINEAKDKKRPSVYKFIREHEIALRFLFPIWISRPDEVALYTPLEKNYFDYGIYDEASQMFLEKSYPILYRSRINIVAGDEKQLKPSSFFSSFDFDDDELEEQDKEFEDIDSLLDKAIISNWNGFMLQNHYRSDSKELISFSSSNIYENKLNYATKNGSQNINALEVININGNFIDQKNIKEAEYVIKLLETNISKYKSILIITLNSKQSSYINSLLINEKKSNPEIINKYMNQEIEVVNLENVQGNEADLVIMSIAYGRKNNDSNIRANFGPIIQNDGKNRLNVAITRAKKKMIVLKSLSSKDIKKSTNENLNLFLKFLDFLDNNESSLKSKTKNLTSKDLPKLLTDIYSEITNLISPLNLATQLNYEVGNKNLDIAIINPKNKLVLLGIKIEYWNNDFNLLQREIDLDEINFFKSRNYEILKIFEHEWSYNKELVLNEIIKKIKIFQS